MLHTTEYIAKCDLLCRKKFLFRFGHGYRTPELKSDEKVKCIDLLDYPIYLL